MNQASKIQAIVEGILSYLEDNQALDLLPEIAKKLVEQSWVRIDPNLALVSSKIKLSQEQIKQIQDILSRQLGRPIRVKSKIDKSIIGGLKINVAGQVIDGTINRQLKALKDQVIYG